MQWPLLFWGGVAVAEFGALRPEFGHPLRPATLAAAAALVALGLLSVKAADLSEPARRRLRFAGYPVGALVLAHQFGPATHVTGLSRTGSLILYGLAAVTAVWSHAGPSAPRKSLLIVSGLDPSELRELLTGRTDDTMAVYRADRVTDELRDLESRYALVLVTGDEHDPRVKERISASGLRRQVPDIAEREVIVAGPRTFTRYVRGALARLAVPNTQVRMNGVKRR
ncbi:hypothetical protein [Nonomuraea sp. NPDC048916]|uniref:hypothetical protein n=1 Tax=Nonomuraea sp. NPDC048916 TaxID=3154232 RepID=UPI0033FFD998